MLRIEGTDKERVAPTLKLKRVPNKLVHAENKTLLSVFVLKNQIDSPPEETCLVIEITYLSYEVSSLMTSP